MRVSEFSSGNKKPEHLVSKVLGVSSATSYSRATYRCTTIGAAAFHFRVRNGNGWGHCAIITRKLPRAFAGQFSGVDRDRIRDSVKAPCSIYNFSQRTLIL
mgnify:CR=1 FL=1